MRKVELRFRKHVVLEQVRAEKRGAIAGGGVFADAVRLEEEAGAQMIGRIVRFAAIQIRQRRQASAARGLERLQVEPALLQRTLARDRHDERRGPGRDLLDRQSAGDVLRRKPNRRRHFLALARSSRATSAARETRRHRHRRPHRT
jgi:hypothetical protein